MEYSFEFEELVPVINDRIVTGMMLYGTATLESADPYEAHEFYVSQIELDGGMVLTPSGDVPKGHHNIAKDLFKAIADIIQNPKHPVGKRAQAEFGDFVDEGGFEAKHYNTLAERTMAYLDLFRPVRGASLDMEGAR